MRPVMLNKNDEQFLRRLKNYNTVIILVATYVVALAGWVIGFREMSSGGQLSMPFVLLLLVFIWKKILLAKTDSMPILMAMLIAGLWLENLDDVFQTLVFTTVDKPGPTFFLLWLRKFAENAAYLLFLTRRWFKFRVWVKDFCKRCWCCR